MTAARPLDARRKSNTINRLSQRPLRTEAVPVFGWFRPTCPVGATEKSWIEDRMRWLALDFGLDRMLKARVILPTPEFFPDRYDADRAGAKRLFRRVCGYMDVDPDPIRLQFFTNKRLKGVEGWQSGAAGTYEDEGWRTTIRLDEAGFADPMGLVATMAHELGHVLLLGQGRITADRKDHEPLTDLITIFLGLGLFTANSRVRTRTEQHAHGSTWSISRLGYLDEHAVGYALALFAWIRGEERPAWLSHLRINPRTYCKRGLRYLLKTGDSSFDPARSSGKPVI